MAKKKSTARKSNSKKKKKSNKYLLFLLVPFGVILFFIFQKKAKNTVVPFEKFTEEIPKDYNSFGIDVSHHQGKIDWETLLSTKGYDTLLSFVYSKTTEGTDFIDEQFLRNREELNAAGVPNGAYHFFKPKESPKKQANHFLANYSYRTIDLPPVLDIEEEGFSDEDVIEKIKIWCEIVENKTGQKPIIYTSLNFYETKFRSKLKKYSFWLAAYSREPEFMSDKNVLHWQFSEKGRLPGISENVDMNVSKVKM